jgi:serine/threonine-protein kinase
MTETLGKYELLHILGKGAMGTVYEGFDPVIERRLAIKTVRLPDPGDLEAQEEIARFKREAQAAGRLSHPNIVGVFDYGETPDIAYIVMEFVDGTTLKHVMEMGERFPLSETVRVMDGILTGLNYSHERGVVHRDIKPANIMITKAGLIKIADFGIARIESSSMTQAGTMLGTPSYMSPEQFMGQTVDSRTDIYSAGVLLYQLLTGEKPFEGGLTAIMHKVLNTEPPAPSALCVTVPPAFDAIVQRAMAKRPEHRFATAGAFAAALRAALDIPAGAAPGNDADDLTMVVMSKPAGRAPAGPPRPAASGASLATGEARKSLPMALIGSLVIIVLAGAGGAAWLLSKHSPAPGPVVSPTAAAKPLAAAPPLLPAAPVVPVLSAAARASLIQATFSGLSCTMLDAQDRGDAYVMTGFAGVGGPALSVTQALASLPAQIHTVDQVASVGGPYCGVLDALRPYQPVFAAPDQRVGLALAGGATTLRDGDLITVDLTMPAFDAYLETDYFSNDGSVLHLYPTASDRQRRQTANALKVLGDPRHGGAEWGVSAPYGTDFIVAIASSVPLFTTPRPADETASDYVAALRTALQTAGANGATISVSAIPVITAPRP